MQCIFAENFFFFGEGYKGLSGKGTWEKTCCKFLSYKITVTLSKMISSARSRQFFDLPTIFLPCKSIAILSRIISSAGSGQVKRLVYEFLLRKNIAILSNINSSAGNHLTECRLSAVSQTALSCSRSSSFPETTSQTKHCMER